MKWPKQSRKAMTEMHLSILLADDMSPKKAKKVMTTANA